MHEVEVTQRPARRVIGIGHKGAYNQIGPAFEALGARVSALGL